MKKFFLLYLLSTFFPLSAGKIVLTDEAREADFAHDFIIVGQLQESKLETIVYQGKFYPPTHKFESSAAGFQGHFGLFSGTIAVKEIIHSKQSTNLERTIKVTWVINLDPATNKQLPSTCPHLGNTTTKKDCIMLLKNGRLGLDLSSDYHIQVKKILLEYKKKVNKGKANENN